MSRFRRAVPKLVFLLALAAPCVAIGQAKPRPLTDAATEAVDGAASPASKQRQSPAPATRSGGVYRVPIEGFIGPGLAYFVKRSVEQAKDARAAAIIFEISTDGGGVDSALEICEHIGSAEPVKTVAFVTGRAWSAGALIAIACDAMYMRPGTTMGSAQPVTIGKEGTEALGEKYVSALQAQFRSFAEKKGYHPELAAAMVDRDVALTQIMVDGVKEIILSDQVESRQKKAEKSKQSFEVVKKVIDKGKLLNLSSKQALDYGFISGIVDKRDDLIAKLGIRENETVLMTTDWSEGLVRVVSHPAVSAILMMLGMLGVWMEFKTPGFGVPGIVGIACFALLFLSRFLLGHATTVEFAIFLVGVVLLFVEIFVIPGFGVCGVAGIICISVGLILSLQKFTFPDPSTQPWDVDIMWENVFTMLLSLSGAVVIFLFALRFLPNTPLFNRLVLQATESAATGYVSSKAAEKELVGKAGVALSVLRPSGRAEIDGQVVAVMTEGEFLEPGQRLEVLRSEGNRIVVRAV